ncbi:F-box protein At1g67340 [Selaginella moellendorffii]|uniref:F-box protein At1g67340 n=1 Tax=Selaginella moellendorffii TaxID=88036 RepID=UPI000D1C2213|nr:F-box protein At1g67340 [Selaginella moellendorffii]|eukprot:XP_024531810.1 F-box protein At1g67340 [Selaginella moellendorffii]
MRTRRGNYPSPTDGIIFSIKPYSHKRQRQGSFDAAERPCKFSRVAGSSKKSTAPCAFDFVPDDLLVDIAMALVSTASSPADLFNMMLICRRFCAAATHPQVLARVSPQAFAVKAGSWSAGSHRFLKQCADVGNVEALYTLGMIRFYCLNNSSGASLMAKAAVASHAAALHSLAVIHFNGSGGRRKDKNLKAGVALCMRAASLGHVDAIRELGHCLQDGYGVVKNVLQGRRLLLEANAREAAAAVAAAFPKNLMELALKRTSRTGCASCPHHRFFTLPPSTKADIFQKAVLDSAGIVAAASGGGGGGGAGGGATNASAANAVERHPVFKLLQNGGCALLSDFGCNVPPAKVHVANKFLVEWFALHPTSAAGLRLCSHANCGRPETRRHEFRRCSACGRVNYCSRACQALDWKLRHKYDCIPVADWENREDRQLDGEENQRGGDEAEEEEDEEDGDDDEMEIGRQDNQQPGEVSHAYDLGGEDHR